MADREAYINGITFGVGRSFVLESVELPQNEYRTQDTENPVGDGMIFGRDRITPGSLTLNILVLGEDSAEVNANLRDLSRAWYRAGDRTKPGNITSTRILRVRLPGVILSRPKIIPSPTGFSVS